MEETSKQCARVTPLFKGGDPLDVNNYHPIYIICTIVQIFEKLIFNQLSHYINLFNILSQFQSGFRPRPQTLDFIPFFSPYTLYPLHLGHCIVSFIYFFPV